MQAAHSARSADRGERREPRARARRHRRPGGDGWLRDWCGPCKVMAPVLDDFARDRSGEVLVTKLDTDRNPVTTQRLGIRAIPTLIVFRSGRETARHAGVTSRQQLDALVAPPARGT